MFGGITKASDPRLLALTGLLANSTREQVAFHSRTREELGDTIRKMLLMVMGLFMEIDACDQSLLSSMDRRIEEARHEENLTATSDAQGHLAAAQDHLKALQEELAWTRNAVKRADERAAVAEARREEVLEQLSSLESAHCERDEAVAQREEVWCQYEAAKADYDEVQVRCETVMAQRDKALARIVVLEQELSKRTESLKDLTLAAEESKLQQQQLCQEVTALERRCSALLEDAKLAKDRVQLACEERLRKQRSIRPAKSVCRNISSSELKAEIKQACEDRL
ncbi:uncharacterized protein LOC122721404 [Manihot esculenta]|uniref:uncharacterized protein LOC122721404 n=1 Tax=Manihot esculenta TaxID=3983 RepID=UPI001CC57BF4|nr:uncharacterized protein LOC122721404 [Manihot esculenta]